LIALISAPSEILLVVLLNTKNMEHQHIYDQHGKQLCCTLEDKINQKAETPHAHTDDDGHDHDHASAPGESNFQLFLPALISFILLMLAIAFDSAWLPKPGFFTPTVRLTWYI
jgi:Cd2+/Zn2+-exporting ATPase